MHPKNADVVYVAAQGHVWGPNPERGIFRSKDGGKTWEKVLFVSDKTGATDLVMDPTNPRVLYAGFWQVYRKAWTLESGGTGERDLQDRPTAATRGRSSRAACRKASSATSASPCRRRGPTGSGRSSSRRRRAASTGPTTRGEKWTRVNSENKLRQRAWYYTRIFADPKNADACTSSTPASTGRPTAARRSTRSGVPHGDNHDLWIDPDDPARMINSNDGGANVSFNGGRSWSSIMNQPTAQFYRVITDDRFPYWIYGAQQDNTTRRASRAAGAEPAST